MRFAVKTAPMHTTWGEMLPVWQEADGIELFESAWTFDHFEPIRGDLTGPCLEGWTMLAAMAQATTRIRVGCLVTGNLYRHPAVLANMAATVDIISDGRLELGLGAGWNEHECDAYGMELLPLKRRFDQFDEACEVIVRLLSDEVTTFEGTHYRLDGARCEPKPVQRPHPPICIGGGGERRTLRAVARWAQHWNVPGGGREVFTHKRDVLFAHCADLGRDPYEITTSTHVPFDPAAGPRALADECAQWAEVGLHLAVVQLPPPHDPAVLGPMAEALAPLA
jgi:F420-dependent oxidoreductase-like protein